MTLRFGSTEDLQNESAKEPALTWRDHSGPSPLSFAGTVSTDEATRLHWARLDGGIDIYQSNGFALGLAGGALHETLPSTDAVDHLRTQLLIALSGKPSGAWFSRGTQRSIGKAGGGNRWTNAGGAWFLLGNVGFTAMLTSTTTRVKEQVLVPVTRSIIFPNADTSSYVLVDRERKLTDTELRVGMSLKGARFELAPVAGLRRTPTRATQGWVQADVSYWIASRVALSSRLSTTGASEDIERARGWSVTIGGKVAPWRKVSRNVQPPEPLIERWELVPGSSGRLLRVWAPGARRVELQGDLTDWLTIALAHEGGDSYRVQLDAPLGPHRVQLRADRGPWRPLPGTPTQEDDFGNLVSVLIFE